MKLQYAYRPTANSILRAGAGALLVLTALVMAPTLARGQATPYVTNLDPAYRDVDALIAAGWVRTAIAAKRPYSRLTMARITAEARRHAPSNGVATKSRFAEALARLEAWYAAEIRSLCADGVNVCNALGRSATLRSVSTDFTWADSPNRNIPTSYDPGGRSFISAAINPLLQKNQGRVLADGATAGVETTADFVLGRHLAAQLHPRAWVTDHAAEGDAGADATMQEAYVRVLAGNLALDIGRNHVADGYGEEAGPILSHNARGFDMVRLSLDRPGVAPLFLSVFGPLNASAMLADMGGNSATPHSKIVVFAGNMHPHPNVELGATILNHFGGEGVTGTSFIKRIQNIFLLYPRSTIESDRALGASARVTIPSARTQVYADMMTTDDHDFFRYGGQAFVTEATWTGGARVTGLGANNRTDVWAEGRRSGVRPYTHHQFRSGLTLDNRIIGDAIGPLARGASTGIDWRGRIHELSFSGAWEQYSGNDEYRNANAEGDDITWRRTVDRADETRLRFIADWVVQRGQLSSSVQLGYEHVSNFAFAGQARSNVLMQLKFDFRP